MDDVLHSPVKKPRASYSLLAFLAMAFLIVGLTGIFSTYAIPVPLERALAREAAFDEAAAAVRGSNPEAALAAMAPRLDDSLPAILKGSGSYAERITAERLRQRARFALDTANLGYTLRLLLIVVTLMATLFGLALAGRPAAMANSGRVQD